MGCRLHVVVPFFGLNYIERNKSLSCARLGKEIYTCWVSYDNINYGVDSIFGDHNVDLSTRKIDSG
jgi:hypothetical protein